MSTWLVIFCMVDAGAVSSVKHMLVNAKDAQQAATYVMDGCEFGADGFQIVAVVGHDLLADFHPRDDNRTAEFGVD